MTADEIRAHSEKTFALLKDSARSGDAVSTLASTYLQIMLAQFELAAQAAEQTELLKKHHAMYERMIWTRNPPSENATP